MLVNESSFDFALCIICYLSIVLDLSYVFLWDLLAFYSTLVLCFFLFVFASRSCLWPCFCSDLQVWVFILGFSFWFLFSFCFLLLFFVYGFYLAFASPFCFFIFCFWLSSGSHFSLLSFTFCLWVEAHYNGPNLMDVVFIISHFHNVVYINPNLPMTLNYMYHFSWKCNIAFPSTTKYILSFRKSL